LDGSADRSSHPGHHPSHHGMDSADMHLTQPFFSSPSAATPLAGLNSLTAGLAGLYPVTATAEELAELVGARERRHVLLTMPEMETLFRLRASRDPDPAATAMSGAADSTLHSSLDASTAARSSGRRSRRMHHHHSTLSGTRSPPPEILFRPPEARALSRRSPWSSRAPPGAGVGAPSFVERERSRRRSPSPSSRRHARCVESSPEAAEGSPGDWDTIQARTAIAPSPLTSRRNLAGRFGSASLRKRGMDMSAASRSAAADPSGNAWEQSLRSSGVRAFDLTGEQTYI
jgi:hypothetical protein